LSKITHGSKRTILIICLVIFAILIPTIYLVIQNSKSNEIDTLQNYNSG
jgi:hypothetical protein